MSLSRTIASALAQDDVSREIIVVDDGSCDNTLAIARSFEAPDVIVSTQPNQGASAARNRAFALSSGRFIQWLDADDILGRGKIRRQLTDLQIRGTPFTLSTCAWASFNFRLANAQWTPTSLWQDLEPAEWLFRKFEYNLFMMNSSWLVSRELTEKAAPWDTRLTLDDDGEYFSRVLLSADRVIFTQGATCYYRKSTFSSLSNVDCSGRKLQSLLLSLRQQIGYLLSLEDSPRTRAAGLKYLQRWYIYFYPDQPALVAQLQKLAADLGGTLAPPRLRSKYSWLRPLIGWRLAREAQALGPKLRHSVLRKYDQLLYHCGNFWSSLSRNSSANSRN